jgi:hypothetical protein
MAKTSEPILDLRKVLNSKISDLYSKFISDNNIKSIANEEKYSKYLTNNDLLDQYSKDIDDYETSDNNIIKRLEIKYINDIIEKFNSLIFMIVIDNGFITNENRYDILYLDEIDKILNSIIHDCNLVSNKDKFVFNIVNELDSKIQKEQLILKELIKNTSNKLKIISNFLNTEIYKYFNPKLRSRTTDISLEIAKFKGNKKFLEEFKETLVSRYNQIKRGQLIRLIKDNDNYELRRQRLIKIINFAELASKTLKNFIIILGILRNSDNLEVKNLIIDDIIETSINYNFGRYIEIDETDRYYTREYRRQKNIFEQNENMILEYYEPYYENVKIYKRDVMDIFTLQEKREEEIKKMVKDGELNHERIKEEIKIKKDKFSDIIMGLFQYFGHIGYTNAEYFKLEAESEEKEKKIKLRETTIKETKDIKVMPHKKITFQSGNVIDIKFNVGDFELGILNCSLNKDNKYYNFLNRIKNNLLRPNIKDQFKKKIKKNYKNLKIKYKLIFDRDKLSIRESAENITNIVGNSIISLFVRFMSFEGDMKFNDLKNYFVINYILYKDEQNNFQMERQDGIDTGGLRRDFITALTNELFEKKIFITRDGTNKYFLNPEFEPDENMKYIIKKISGLNDTDFQTYIEDDFINDFYKFLGQLLTFILVNDCGLEKPLSSYILASFCTSKNKGFNNYDYISFIINDFPEEFKGLCYFLQNPQKVNKELLYNYNDLYLLSDVDIQIASNIDNCDCSLTIKELDKINRRCKLFCVTSENLDDYIRKIAKFMMTKTVLRKNIDISPDKDYKKISERGEKITSLLISGIPEDIRLELYSNNFCPWVINSYIKNPDMNIEIINILILNFATSMKEIIDDIRNKVKKDQLKKISEIFVNFILKNENSFHKDEENYFKFISNLLKFWSGSSSFKENEKYKIQINSNLSEEHLPQSHTCFFLIDIPNYTGTDIEIGRKMFDKINTAIFNVEAGTGFAGGGMRRKRKNK